jgi:hypothetical protein
MENPTDNSNFVVCRCRHCEECIEFDAADLAEEFSLVPCPHCGLETRLGVPVEVNHPEPGEMATPAQLDYIRSLGMNPSAGLPFEAARIMIQEAPNTVKATAKQLALIRTLGVDAGTEFSRVEADQIIARMLEKHGQTTGTDTSPLVRQMQILRFWDRIDLALSSKSEVAQWLNEFYDADPRRSVAWERFQTEYGPIWSDDPFWVPIGMCESYLKQS